VKGTVEMNFYFAPMEGITGYIYRNAHNMYFPSVDKYFSPFIVTHQNCNIKNKELNDILPEHNENLVLVPQLLSNNAEDFIFTSKKIKELGYDEINLNLGCPSRTVVTKNRGSGFLAKRAELDVFLDKIFTEGVTSISIKTRIGKDSPDEFSELLEIFNKYPIKELIIHPRIQKDYYKNKPNMEIFRQALQGSRNPIHYNGDIFSIDDYRRFSEEFAELGVETVMLGRGLIANPGLAYEIRNHEKPEKVVWKEFHDNIYADYQQILSGDRNVLFKMKELWVYLIQSFSDPSKYEKKIRKAERLVDYEEAVSSLFREQSVDGYFSAF
jgi:tRNA-dihydrouridine synthase